MSLHEKCVISFILLCTLLCATLSFGNDDANNNIGAGESGEDENLKEALLLVELLKNEYTKALRENFILRQKMAESTTEPPEEPTCASTTQLSSSRVTAASSTTASRAPTSRRPVTTTRATSVLHTLGSMPSIPTDLTRRKAIQNFLHNKNFRRRMPSNYLYGSDALQSLRRAEEVSEEPAASESPDLGNETETVTAESDVSTSPPETTAQTADTAAGKTDAPKSDNAVKNKDEPVLSQVADELMSEMKDDKQLLMLKVTSGRTRRTTRNTRYLSAIKPTLKIHLSKSTRLSVPLSKNNAFCYFNPKNALCRTSV